MRNCLLTLDVGTSTIKAMIWEKSGRCVFAAKQGSPPLIFAGDAVEQNIQQFDLAIKILLSEIKQSSYFNKLACMAITTQRNTLIGMQDNQCLTPLISWLDNRGKTINGTRVDWLCDVFPAFSNINRIRSLMSWLIEKLTGIANETASTMPQEWHQSQREEIKLLDYPGIVPLGNILTTNPIDHALKTLLPIGLPIILGAGDKDCSLLGGQAYLPEQGVLCCGTAISLGKLIPNKPMSRSADIYLSPSEFGSYYPIETGIADKRILTDATNEVVIYAFMRCKKILTSQGIDIKRLILSGNDEFIPLQANELAHALLCDIALIQNNELTSSGLAAIAMKAMGEVETLHAAADMFHPKEVTLFKYNVQTAKKWQKDYKRFCENFISS